MTRRATRSQIGLTVLVIIIYVAVLLHNLHESERRSLQLNETPITGDYVGISIRIVEVNPTTSEMMARVTFSLDGSIAKDPATPAADLKLLLNEIRGPQEIDFPRGRRINPIEAFFSLDGNVNQYPFDRYETSIWIMVTQKARSSQPSRPLMGKADKKAVPLGEMVGGFVVAAPQESEPLPIVLSIAASIPGLKFKGQRVEHVGREINGFKLVVRRADNVIVVSILIMVLMMSLAMSVLMMSLQALVPNGKLDLLPLSLCVALLFGLPALRNAEPEVPALGAFGDYLSFLWAEPIVAVSAVILIWTWLLRQRRTM